VSPRVWQAGEGAGQNNLPKSVFSFLDFACISTFHSRLKDLSN